MSTGLRKKWKAASGRHSYLKVSGTRSTCSLSCPSCHQGRCNRWWRARRNLSNNSSLLNGCNPNGWSRCAAPGSHYLHTAPSSPLSSS